MRLRAQPVRRSGFCHPASQGPGVAHPPTRWPACAELLERPPQGGSEGAFKASTAIPSRRAAARRRLPRSSLCFQGLEAKGFGRDRQQGRDCLPPRSGGMPRFGAAEPRLAASAPPVCHPPPRFLAGVEGRVRLQRARRRPHSLQKRASTRSGARFQAPPGTQPERCGPVPRARPAIEARSSGRGKRPGSVGTRAGRGGASRWL